MNDARMILRDRDTLETWVERTSGHPIDDSTTEFVRHLDPFDCSECGTPVGQVDSICAECLVRLFVGES